MDSAQLLQNFEHLPDGSWRCVERAVITTADGELVIEPGMSFAYGQRHGHLDVAEYLEQLGAQFGS